jgi:hypothetical protein
MPIPVPPSSFRVVKYGSKTRAFTSGGIPTPVSRTVSRKLRPPASPAPADVAAPGLEALGMDQARLEVDPLRDEGLPRGDGVRAERVPRRLDRHVSWSRAGGAAHDLLHP